MAWGPRGSVWSSATIHPSILKYPHCCLTSNHRPIQADLPSCPPTVSRLLTSGPLASYFFPPFRQAHQSQLCLVRVKRHPRSLSGSWLVEFHLLLSAILVVGCYASRCLPWLPRTSKSCVFSFGGENPTLRFFHSPDLGVSLGWGEQGNGSCFWATCIYYLGSSLDFSPTCSVETL